MTKIDDQKNKLQKVSGGGHQGGTHFGQQQGDANKKIKNSTQDHETSSKDEQSK